MARQGVERKLTTILAADVVGYSRLMAEDETGTFAQLKTHLHEVIEPKAAEHHGRVVKLTGDGTLMEFSSVVDAVSFAVAVQQAMEKRNAGVPEDRRIRYLVGINLGEIIVDDDDIYGDGVNNAARLEGLAAPGGICISDKVYREVRNKLSTTFEDLGEQNVKNIPEPVRVYRWSEAALVTPIDTPQSMEKRSIAVLPFDNMSSDAEQEYFADGITEDIITTLSKIPELTVIARNSTFAYKGMPVSVKKVAAELDVRFILEGSVRRSGNRMRITAQLIDAADESHVWAERYDRNVEDIFDVQDDITRRIAVAMQAELVMGDYAELWQGGSKNFEAWQFKAQGVYEFLKLTRAGILKTRELFEKAIALEPDDETTMAALGHCYDHLGGSNYVPDREAALATAQDWSERILAANSQSAPGYILLGSVQRSRGQFDDAVTSAERALELAPNESTSHAFLAATLVVADAPSDAIKHIETAIRLNPNYPAWFGAARVQAYRMTGRRDQALKAAIELAQRHPEFIRGRVLQAAAYVDCCMPEEARQAIQAVLELDPNYTISDYVEQYKLKNASLREEIATALRQAGLPD